MIRKTVAEKISTALQALVQEGALPDAAYPAIEIAEPRQAEHGDFACNIALAASKTAGRPPRVIADALAVRLRLDASFEQVEVAGPGFLNLRLASGFVGSFVGDVLVSADLSPMKDAAHYAHVAAENPRRINVEFVSVNPNGPITIGSGRGAAYGSTLCNVLEAAGNTVHREYYVNDGTSSEQMRLFAESVLYFVKRSKGVESEFPIGGYRGDYVVYVAEELQSFGFHPNLAQILDEVIRRNSNDIENVIFSLESLDTEISTLDLGELPSHRSFTYGLPYDIQTLSVLRSDLRSSLRVLEINNNAFLQFQAIVKNAQGSADSIVSFLDRPTSFFQSIAQEIMLLKQRKDLSSFGVEYDTWFSEQSLHTSGMVGREVQHLIANHAADTNPIRHKLKLAKGGVVEDVEIESQTKDVDEEGNAVEAPLPQAGEVGGGLAQPSDTLWLRSTKFADDMDRVLRRRDGRTTYIASDVAYHKDKFNRPENADHLITVLGPDHHGYIGRLTAVVAAALLPETQTEDPDSPELTEVEAKLYASKAERDTCRRALAEAREKLTVQIYQLVRFMKDGKPAPMRKRDGNIYALIDLINEIGAKVKPNGTVEQQQEAGKDVARFFYLMRHHDTTFDFDLDLAEKQSDENPVFYVQYAHARICSVLRKAEESGIPLPQGGARGGLPQQITLHEREKSLLLKIFDLPEEVARCAEDYAVNRLATYAIELARSYHHFYDACRVIQPDQPDLTHQRLAICEAARIALKSVLDILGVSAPERMERETA